MHFEILVEDQSTKIALEYVVPKVIGLNGETHSWRLHPYKGIGKVPPGLQPKSDAAKRILLDQLPRLLRGYRNTPGIDYVIVVADTDRRDCRIFLDELKAVALACGMEKNCLFRLAIEETEAWYIGDREALAAAYPAVRLGAFDGYVQDSACGTWELLANAIHPGGAAAIQKVGWPLAGKLKSEWAAAIGPLLVPERNASSSFQKFCSGLRRISASNP